MPTPWTDQELSEIDAHDEMQISSLRPDGALSSDRTIWAVREGARVYVRSVNGSDAAWFRNTRARLAGQISVGALTRDVTFTDIPATNPVEDRLDDAFRTKYRSHDKSIVDRMTSPQARAATLELVPRDPDS